MKHKKTNINKLSDGQINDFFEQFFKCFCAEVTPDECGCYDAGDGFSAMVTKEFQEYLETHDYGGALFEFMVCATSEWVNPCDPKFKDIAHGLTNNVCMYGQDATNLKRWICCMVNIVPDPAMVQMVKENLGQDLDTNLYVQGILMRWATKYMFQDDGGTTVITIPSDHMFNLFKRWLNHPYSAKQVVKGGDEK